MPLSVHSVAAVIFFAAAAALALSLAGVLVGIWCDKFDNIAFITNFFITPLAFLSGTFYSVERLPDPWLSLSRIDPFFYMIDGFRYGFIGQSGRLDPDGRHRARRHRRGAVGHLLRPVRARLETQGMRLPAR